MSIAIYLLLLMLLLSVACLFASAILLAAHVFVSRVSQRCLLTRQADMSGWHVTRRQDMSPFCVFQRVQKTQDSRHADTSPRHVFWEYTTFYRSCNKHNSKHKLVLLTSNLNIILLDLSIRCIFSIKNPIFLGPGDHLKSNVQYCPIIMKKRHADNDGCRWMYVPSREIFDDAFCFYAIHVSIVALGLRIGGS